MTEQLLNSARPKDVGGAGGKDAGGWPLRQGRRMGQEPRRSPRLSASLACDVTGASWQNVSYLALPTEILHGQFFSQSNDKS
ncbi:MAG TPA: hypothetical protein DEF25_10080 [Thermoanaerobacter sp.]|nr:hypothetical protein [Thermoanaerobacter sp.]